MISAQTLAPTRHAPAVLGCAAVVAAAVAGLTATGALTQGPVARPALVERRPVSLALQLRPGETLLSALSRAGIPVAEAREAAALFEHALGARRLRGGAALQAAVQRPSLPDAPARLVALQMRTGPASELALARAPDGALSVQTRQEAVREETHVATGVMKGSFYESALAAGATPGLVSEAVALFSKTLDFAREIRPGDGFRLVFERRASATGRTVEAGALLYAEIGAKGRVRRFYRFEHDGRTDWLDETGLETKALLLKTPLDGARVTSAFGMRLHPILGYNRLHPGIDFGAPSGTPVYAAGDGVVEEVKWAGGYGHWLKLKHAQGFETGYGHLSAYAPGMKPGVEVRQGQVVAFVGSTGLSTGAHLHYEIMRGGEKIDPSDPSLPQVSALSAEAVAAFRRQQARVDALLGRAPALRMAEAAAPLPSRS